MDRNAAAGPDDWPRAGLASWPALAGARHAGADLDAGRSGQRGQAPDPPPAASVPARAGTTTCRSSWARLLIICGSRRARTVSSRASAESARSNFYDLATVVPVAQAPPPGRAADMAGRRVRGGVHAGVDRLAQRQPPPRAARPRRRSAPQHVPAADPGAGRDGRLIPRRAARAEPRSPSPRRYCSRSGPCCGCWLPAATPRIPLPSALFVAGRRPAPPRWPLRCCHGWPHPSLGPA